MQLFKKNIYHVEFIFPVDEWGHGKSGDATGCEGVVGVDDGPHSTLVNSCTCIKTGPADPQEECSCVFLKSSLNQRNCREKKKFEILAKRTTHQSWRTCQTDKRSSPSLRLHEFVSNTKPRPPLDRSRLQMRGRPSNHPRRLPVFEALKPVNFCHLK